MVIITSNIDLCNMLDINRLVDYSYHIDDINNISETFKQMKLENL